MALDFPASPTNGQIFSSGGVSWTFDGEKWKISSSGIEPVFISSSTPTGVAGQIYWDSDESTAYIYYDDGNTAQWVPLVSTAPVSFDTSAIVSGTLPVARGGTGTTSFDAGKIVEGNTEAEVVDTGSDGHFKVTIEGTERFKIDSSGNVGIPTISPGSLLTVEASTGDATATIHAAENDSGADAQLEIETSNDFAESAVAFKDSTGLAGSLRYNHGDNAIRFLGEGNNAEMARFDSSGRLLVGAVSARTNWNDSSIEPKIIVEGAGDSDSTAICVVSNSGTSSGASRGALLTLARTKGTADGSNTAVDQNTALGIIEFKGNDGTNFTTAAKIFAAVDGTPGTDDMPGRLVFATTADGASSPTERMRINEKGCIHHYGDSSATTFLTSSSTAAGTSSVIIAATHSATGVGTGTTSFKVFTNGNVQNTNSSYGQISDVKLKENIVDANSQWDDIKNIQVRNFNFKEETGNPTHTQIGVVAQELETVSPGLVYETPDTDHDGNDLGTVTKAVSYSVLYMKAVKALQEAMDRIETLEAKVAALEAE